VPFSLEKRSLYFLSSQLSSVTFDFSIQYQASELSHLLINSQQHDCANTTLQLLYHSRKKDG